MNKRMIGNCSFALMSALLFTQVDAISAQTVETTVAPTETTVAPTNVQPFATTTPAEKPIVILHTNDMHGRMEEETNKDGSTKVLGLAKLDALADAEKAKADQTTLLLDAGDAFQGLPVSNISKGEEMAKIMNEIGYDAMAIGNHEFDFGLDQLKKLDQILTFPLLSSNTYVNGARLFEASTIIDKDTTVDGDEVVVIGVTTPETATKTHPNNIVGVKFTDPITEVLNVIKEIEAKATAAGKTYNNYVILGHLGVDATTQDAWRGDTLLEQLTKEAVLKAKNLVFLDGHSHTVLTQKLADNVVYQQTGTALANVGKVTLKSNAAIEAELIKAADTGKMTASTDIASQVKAAKDGFEEATSGVVIENNDVQFDGIREDVRSAQTNLGDLIADAMYEYSKTGFSAPSDLAVTNGGGIRASIDAGNTILESDIISVLPFGNIIAQIEVNGQTIQDMFVHALDAANLVDENGAPVYREYNGEKIPQLSAAGHFLHIAGARVYYDANAENVADRKVTVEILDPTTQQYVPLDLKKMYRLTTNDFLAVGGDGYDMLGGERQEGPSLDTVLMNFIKANKDLSSYKGEIKFDRVIPELPKAPTSTIDPIETPEETIEGGGAVASDDAELSTEEETTIADDKDKVTDSDNGKVAATSSKLEKSSKSSKETLPQTGESDHLAIFGAAALSILTGLGLAVKVSNKEN